MKRVILKWGLISGGIFALTMSVMMALYVNGKVGLEKSELAGYTTMVAAFLMVFFGIRTYRESAGGTITFGQAFKVGLGITLISCAIYVASWEVIYFGYIPDFGERYGTHMVNKMRSEGASDAAILQKQQEMADFAKMYKNPLVNAGLTFLEVFPLGLVVTLVSAAILRRRTPDAAGPATAVASGV